ncbi:MAG: L,D-transpeptidase family protein [Thermodesulforhabdaceae bacterium]
MSSKMVGLRILFGLFFLVPMVLSGCSLFSSPPKEAKVEKPVLPPKTELKFDYLRPASMVKDPKIFVYKSKRRMYVFDGDTIVRDYPIGLGKNPQGDKEREGDGRTPEGMFYVCKKNERSKFYKSIGLSYPTLAHAEKALYNGLISVSDYKRIEDSLRRMDTPPWDTPLGGYIFIHGGGAHSDWTEGCIALYNSDMDELFEMVRIGTPVYVYP